MKFLVRTSHSLLYNCGKGDSDANYRNSNPERKLLHQVGLGAAGAAAAGSVRGREQLLLHEQPEREQRVVREQRAEREQLLREQLRLPERCDNCSVGWRSVQVGRIQCDDVGDILDNDNNDDNDNDDNDVGH